jgi:hypothetical protein
MRTFKITIFLLGLFFSSIHMIQAQEGSVIAVNYLPALPLGNTANFTGNFTGRGVGMEFYLMKTRNSGFGIELSTTGFADQKQNETIQSGTVAVTGTQFNALSTTSVMPSYIFVIGDHSKFKPFVSLAGGLTFLTQRVDMGVFVLKETGTHVSVRPEIGAMYKVSDYVGIKLSTKYTSTFGGDVIASQSFLGFNLGFVMLSF